ncbi:MAG: hypothetical protein DHS20C11_10160 [Lysobacteraceae bacterium]|nr:MAG: hypothetical protein DHS20C11_10160 [Xanthomonadaceae bacterium]
MPSPSSAKEYWSAPSYVAKDPINILFSGEMLDLFSPSVIRFHRVVALHGEVGTEATVKLDEELAAKLTPGERYIVLFSPYKKQRTPPKGYVKNRDGPMVVSREGLAPAVFLDSEASRAVMGVHDNAVTAGQLMDIMGGADFNLAESAAMELVMGSVGIKGMSDREYERFESLARTGPPKVRLIALFGMSKFGRRPDMLKIANETLADVNCAITASYSELIRFLIDEAEPDFDRSSLDMLLGWARCPQAVVYERALTLVKTLDAEAWQDELILQSRTTFLDEAKRENLNRMLNKSGE